LNGARFEKSDLRGCNFSQASLCGAVLCGADLREANLEGTRFGKHSSHKIIDQEHTWYDQYTKWPENFDPESHEGLCKIDMDFYRQVRFVFVQNYVQDCYWSWDMSATVALMSAFDVQVTDIPVPISPEMMVVLQHLRHICNISIDHFVVDENVILTKKQQQYPTVAERVVEYGIEEDQEYYPRVLEPVSFLLWLFPDGYIHRYDAFSNYALDVENNYILDSSIYSSHIVTLVRIGEEWVVFNNNVSYGTYCDENFDGYGAFGVKSFATEAEAIACYEESRKKAIEEQFIENEFLDTHALILSLRNWLPYLPDDEYKEVVSFHQLQNLQRFMDGGYQQLEDLAQYCEKLAAEWGAHSSS